VKGLRLRLRTPRGELMCEKLIDPILGSAANHRHYVQTPADYEILLSYFRDLQVKPNFEAVQRDLEACGDDGLPLVAVARTPYQQLWVEWVSIEKLSVDLADAVPALLACLEELARIERDIFRVLRDAVEKFSLALVDIPDNITAPMIGRTGSASTACRSTVTWARSWPVRRRACRAHGRQPAAAAPRDREFSHPGHRLALAAAGQRQPRRRSTGAETGPQAPDHFPSSVHLAEPERIYAVASGLLADAGTRAGSGCRSPRTCRRAAGASVTPPSSAPSATSAGRDTPGAAAPRRSMGVWEDGNGWVGGWWWVSAE